MSSADLVIDRGMLRRRRGFAELRERLFEIALLFALLVALGILVILLQEVARKAIPVFSERGADFLTSNLSGRSARAGVAQAITGSLQIAFITAVIAFPLGILTAVWLEEFAPDNRVRQFIDVNIRNLAGVPSIVYGLLGFAIFVGVLEPLTGGKTALAGGLTLAVLALPIVVITAAEAIRAVPQPLREGGYGLGATRSQVARKLVLPHALPGILTGVILSLSRAIGETAPLLVVGAASFLTADAAFFSGMTDRFTALPVVVYSWSVDPDPNFRGAAAPAAIIILLLVTLSLNAVAIWLRNRYEKRKA